MVASRTAAMLCPVCQVGLGMSERQGIEIDFCPQCRGVWLDRGELDKIIERSAAPEAVRSPVDRMAPVPPPGFGRSDDHRGYYQPKRRKSFLEDLFD